MLPWPWQRQRLWTRWACICRRLLCGTVFPGRIGRGAWRRFRETRPCCWMAPITWPESLALAEALADYRYRKLFLVLGIMADKDVSEIVSVLAPLAATCYCVTPAIDRAMDDVTLAAVITGLGIPARACGTVANGIRSAQRDAEAGDLILVCGSLFTVGEAKAWLAGTDFEGIRG